MKKTIGVCCMLVLAFTLVTGGAQATMLQPNNTWDQLLAETLTAVEGLTVPTATVSVNGSGQVTVVPDMAIVNVGVSVTQPSVKDAQDQVNTAMNDILTALGDLGIAEDKMATSNYSVYPVYDYSDTGERTLRGYQVTNQLNVTVVDFAQINDVLDTAVENGANEINGLTFEVADQSTYYQQALVAAVQQAQIKAETLAQASGKTLGDLLEITEGTSGYSAYAMRSVAMEAGAGGTNIQAGETEIGATVTLVYELK